MYAVRNGRLKTAKSLLGNGADVNEKNYMGGHGASFMCHKESANVRVSPG